MPYDLVIIGAGPAGLTAAIYAKRACLKTLIFEKEKDIAGGKLNKTADVENYPGFTKISGPELAQKMTEHAKSYQVNWEQAEVINLEKKEQKFIIKTNEGGNFTSKSIIIASGAIEKKLRIKGEKELTNRGVSSCVICDGFLFKGQKVAVVGGGYSALEAALHMSNIASQVYLIHRRETFRAEKEIAELVKGNSKITLLLNSILTEIKGKKVVENQDKEVVEKVIVSNLLDNQKNELLVEAVFPCIGLSPFSSFTHKLGICDGERYIAIKEDCSTSVPGLFAAGDVARVNQNKIKQIVTAVAEGAIAAQSVIKYLKIL